MPSRPARRLAATALLAAALLLSSAGAAQAAGGSDNPLLNWEPEPHSWSFEGPFGTFDRAALQRGYMVYEAACQTCHTLRHVAYRTMVDMGFTEAQVKALTQAQSNLYEGLGFEEYGDLVPADHFPDIYNTEARRQAAAEAYGVVPPDLSLMAKAREGGPDYIRSLLVGYFEDPETGETLNHYYPGGRIAMPPPLIPGAIGGDVYPDGTPATVDQMAADVSHFLMWTAEPKMEDRKRTGAKVMLFLFVLAALMYAVKQRVWADLH